ncbi:MAG: hypothetical protein UDB11_00750 [Peptococcaceae bacterium]|nr:hypothetical protein [Peptococcaceae bacterium]
MANFADNVITDVGRVMFGDVQMGKILIPTRIVIGSGRLPTGTTTRTITDVVSPIVDLDISKKQKSEDGTVIFGGVYSNESIEEDFYFRELALYAKAGEDGEEVLFSYGNAGETADYMPAYTSGTPVQRQIDLSIYVGNETQVDLTIADGVYVTMEQLKAEVHNVLNDLIGKPNGIASLDDSGKVPSTQLPDMDYIPISEKGVANGVATLGDNGKVPTEQLSQNIDTMANDINILKTTVTNQGKQLASWWVYLKENYDYTCDMPADTSTKPYSYTETVKDGETIKGTLVTTMNADDTYTEVYTIGETTRTRTWSKADNQWKGVWS